MLRWTLFENKWISQTRSQMLSPTQSVWATKSTRYAHVSFVSTTTPIHPILTHQDELKAELEALEQEELDDRLAGAERAPIHAPTSPVGVTTGRERMLNIFRMTEPRADCHKAWRREPRRTTRKRNCDSYKPSLPCSGACPKLSQAHSSVSGCRST